MRNAKVIALFDIDGTLTPSRASILPNAKAMLDRLRTKVCVGVVGGSDLAKQQEQLGDNVTRELDYSFSQNGLVAYRNGELIHSKKLSDEYSPARMNEFLSFVLHYVADLDIPVKRGTFVEFRSGMINISPIGRNCSREERNDFEKYDQVHHVREDMVKVLESKFADMNFKYSIGGQISFDVFPKGWDKTYCLQFLLDQFDEIHFFGDKTMEGGNDYEIYTHPRVIGHSVKDPEDTIRQVTELFLKD